MVSVVVSVVSAVIAVLALLVSYRIGSRSARASERSAAAAEASREVAAQQLANASAAQEAALQPYVWADLRPRDDGGLLSLVVGNSGPTVATNVRVSFDPPLTTIVPSRNRDQAARTSERLASGLRSIAPGRTISWNMGVAHEYFGTGAPANPVPEVALIVTGCGPRGDLAPTEYVIATEDLRHQADRPVGVAVLESPLRKIADAIERQAKIAAQAGVKTSDEVSLDP